MTRRQNDEGRTTVVAFTSHRPTEVVGPLRESDLDAEVVCVAADGSFVDRCVETVRRTRSALRRRDPDAVLLDCFEVMGVLVTLLSMAYRVPVVARLVGDTWLRFENAIRDARAAGRYRRAAYYRLALSIDEFVFARAIGFVVVSDALGEIVAERTSCPADRIRTVPVPDPALEATADGGASAAGADGNRDAGPARKHGIEAETVLLTVTNLTYRAKLRGVDTVLDAVCPLLERDPGLAYVVAGGGEYADALVRSLEERDLDPGVRSRIHTLGFVDDIGALYELADVFVYVSFLDGYPRVVLEAQGAGLPVVANDAFGMREQVAHGESGALVDPSDADALRRELEALIADPALRRQYGERGRDRLHRENSPAAVGRRLEEALVSIIAKQRGERR
ncbi:glycosyltransferase family 4 protein [Halorubrum sp. DTA46]|uniref:glycosyltransferase family 4 protein n=1 Tax=Halorubrum sp. DTA46 TaxID=3402162 RepID=UPI003AAEA955